MEQAELPLAPSTRARGPMNLLDHFILKHVQVTLLQARLIKAAAEPGGREARVELKLTPRTLQADAGDSLPAYQVGAQLLCESGEGQTTGPHFSASVGFETVYQQVHGDPVDLAEFTSNHASLTRQLYPLLQHELRGLLLRIGLEQIHLPCDLAVRVQMPDGGSIQLSGALH